MNAVATATIRILALAAVLAAFAAGPSWAAEPAKTVPLAQWLDRHLKSDQVPEWQKRAIRAEMAGDFKTAVKFARQGAQAGDGMSFMMLGVFYEIGQGVEKDLRKAAEYYGKSVDSGNKLAGVMLGYLHLNGLGVPRDRALAIQYFRLAVAVIANSPGIEKEYEPLLGHRGVPKELLDAIAWARRLDKASGKEAYEWSVKFRTGRGAIRNQWVADALLTQASNRGFPAAYFDKAMLEFSKPKPKRNKFAAKMNLYFAARFGHVVAQRELGLRYGTGDGVDRIVYKAYYWLLRARDGGAQVSDALNDLEKVLTPADREHVRWRREDNFPPVL